MAVAQSLEALSNKKTETDNLVERKRAIEMAEKIEAARNLIEKFSRVGKLKEEELLWRLREEEVSARNRITVEYQALEAALLAKMQKRDGILERVPNDPFSWTVEWSLAPQQFSVNVTSLRGLRSKVRDGYYVLLCSVYDRVGGSCLRFSTGERNKDCTAALPPLRFKGKSTAVDRYINKHVELMCPAPVLLHSHAVLIIELWRLKVGKYDPVDTVVGFGYWPLVNKDFRVVEGKFKMPMLKGEAEETVDTFRMMFHSLESGLSYWLANVYFEIKILQKGRGRQTIDAKEANSFGAAVDVGVDALRLDKTADDIRSLTFPRLPPRLFFDDVKAEAEDDGAVKQHRHDQVDMTESLWEKRHLLEDEKNTMRNEIVKRKSRSLASGLDDDAEICELRMRSDLAAKGTTKRRLDDQVVGEADDEQKSRDSHVLLCDHHIALVSQREFFFLGRRWRDKTKMVMVVLQNDMGIYYGGPWDKAKVVTCVIFGLLGLYARWIIHAIAKYLYLQFLDVPLTFESWNVYSIDLRFEHNSRFRPMDSMITTMVGTAAVMFMFVFVSVTLFLLMKIFDKLPYWMTRFAFWLGIAGLFDSVITVVTESAVGNFDSGECFLLYNQLTREEQSGVYGAFLTVALYLTLAGLQSCFIYLFAIYVHLNGRVIDTYDRLLMPESSFFMPHDLELSELELKETVAKAKNFRTEQGDIKRVSVNSFNHRFTCLFRERLFKLLSVLSNDPDEWVSQYIDKIALRRPVYAEDFIENSLGTFSLGSDILLFMKRNFPHMCALDSRRIGDAEEDYYYESDLIRAITSHSTAIEDDKEMRDFLKAYFSSQVSTGKPVEWCDDDKNAFVLKDKQLLADLIFFETSRSQVRGLLLMLQLREYCDDYLFIDEDEEDTWQRVYLPRFDRDEPVASIEGAEALGSIIHITMENPVAGTRQLLRAFIVTQFGMILEPTPSTFTLLASHTADHAEYWCAKAVLLGKKIEERFANS